MCWLIQVNFTWGTFTWGIFCGEYSHFIPAKMPCGSNGEFSRREFSRDIPDIKPHGSNGELSSGKFSCHIPDKMSGYSNGKFSGKKFSRHVPGDFYCGEFLRGKFFSCYSRQNVSLFKWGILKTSYSQ